MPALQSLWNAHDVDVGHKRRYDKKSMKKLLESSGFDVVEMKYFFISILPLLYLRRVLNPARANQIPKGDSIPKTNFLINKILSFILNLENLIISLPFMPNPPGGSLLVIARKKLS